MKEMLWLKEQQENDAWEAILAVCLFGCVVVVGIAIIFRIIVGVCRFLL
jgi:hypothetical protein